MSDYIRPRTIVLESSKDWARWLPTISGAAGSYWPHWDPNNRNQPAPVEKPVMPAITRPRVQPAAPGTQTRAQSAQAQQSGESNHEVQEEELYTYAERIERYKLLMPLYLAYDKQESEVRKEIMRYVSSSIQLQLDELPRDLAGWMHYLRATYGENEHRAQEDAEKDYQAVLKKVRDTPLEQWLKKWQNALFEATRLKVPRVANGKWLSDLANELGYLHLHTTALAEGAYQSQETNPLNSNSAASWAERVLSEYKRREDNQGGRSVKGAAFATLDIGGGADLSDGKRGRVAANDNRWPKRKPREEQWKPREMCEACQGIGHKLEQCFGVFPERAPRDFGKGILAHYVRIVKNSSESNLVLRQKIETARKAAADARA